MADGQQHADDTNPFTFKSFVTKKEHAVSKPKDADDDEDIFDFTDDTTQRKRDKPKKQILVVEEDDPAAKPKKKGKKENPFSFKKFLSTSNTSKKPGENNSKPLPRLTNDMKEDETNRHIEDNMLPPLPSGLPDFVQDHYSDIDGLTHTTRLPQLDLPNFSAGPSSDLDSPDEFDHDKTSICDSATASEHNINNDNRLDPGVTGLTVDSDDDGDSIQERHLIDNLPDFLSDTTVGNTKSAQRSLKTSSSELLSDCKVVQENQSQAVLKLQQENTSLKEQVEILKGKKKDHEIRIGELQQLLVEQKKKEADDTAVMEHAMEQVEQNLSDTTKRAVKAESTVSKLKQEMKSLQEELKSLRGQSRVSDDQAVTDIKERTKYVADQLKSATKTAETSLKQLLSGVDQLKLMSQVLTSIDKISEDTSANSEAPH